MAGAVDRAAERARKNDALIIRNTLLAQAFIGFSLLLPSIPYLSDHHNRPSFSEDSSNPYLLAGVGAFVLGLASLLYAIGRGIVCGREEGQSGMIRRASLAIHFLLLLESGISIARMAFPQVDELNTGSIIFGIMNLIALGPAAALLYCRVATRQNVQTGIDRAPLLAVVPHDLPVARASHGAIVVDRRTASAEVQECLDWLLNRDHRDDLWRAYSFEGHFFKEYVRSCAENQRVRALPKRKEELVTFLENLNKTLSCPITLCVPKHPCRITKDEIYVFERDSLTQLSVRVHPMTRVPFSLENHLRKPKKAWTCLFNLTYTLWREHKTEFQILARPLASASTASSRTSLVRWGAAPHGALALAVASASRR